MLDLSRDVAMATKQCWVKRESNEGKLIPRAFFAHLPGGSTVIFCYYLLAVTLQRRAGYTQGYATHF